MVRVRWLPPVLRRPLVQDVALAAVLVALSLDSLWNPSGAIDFDFREPDLLGVLLALLGSGTVVLRSRLPVLTLAVSSAAVIVQSQLGYSHAFAVFAPLFALYSVAVARSLRTSAAMLGAVAAGVVGVLLTGPYDPGLGDWAANLLGILVVWGFGRSISNRRVHARNVEMRNRAVQEAREAETRTLIVEERGRTARDLQDLVAHHLTEVSVQVAAARRVLERDPESARGLLLGAERAGREALDEMRRAGGVLDEEQAHASLRPQPTLDDVGRLVEEERSAGLRIRYSRTGQAPDVPAGVQLAAFRLVEESLHLGRTRSDRMPVSVVLEESADRLRVAVTCGPQRDRVTWDPPSEPGDGQMARLRARVELYGGDLVVGHRRDGSFRLVGEFPLGESPDTGEDPADTGSVSAT